MAQSLSKQPFNKNKEKLSICYSFVREQNRLLDILEDDEYGDHADYLKAKIAHIEAHITRHFTLTMRMNCRSMHADKRNRDYNRYIDGNWVVYQTNKKYGAGVNSWMRAKQIRELIGAGGIPF